MAADTPAIRLDFRLEPDASTAETTDFQSHAAKVRDAALSLPAVEEAEAHVAEPTRDLYSTIGVVLTIAAAVKTTVDAAEVVARIVSAIKKLAHDHGLPNAFVWVGRKKIPVDDLSAMDHKTLAAQPRA